MLPFLGARGIGALPEWPAGEEHPAVVPVDETPVSVPLALPDRPGDDLSGTLL